jgi:hypothetical protein
LPRTYTREGEVSGSDAVASGMCDPAHLPAAAVGGVNRP